MSKHEILTLKFLSSRALQNLVHDLGTHTVYHCERDGLERTGHSSLK